MMPEIELQRGTPRTHSRALLNVAHLYFNSAVPHLHFIELNNVNVAQMCHIELSSILRRLNTALQHCNATFTLLSSTKFTIYVNFDNVNVAQVCHIE